MIRKVAVIMGSDSDWPVVKGACAQLKALDIPFEAHILSAHRTPAEAAEFAKNARANGFGVILCAAGMAAHLAGAFAANTTLPVIGIPMKGGAMDGLDALLATVQMPSGIPVATVALNGAKNAAWLAAEIDLREQIHDGCSVAVRIERRIRGQRDPIGVWMGLRGFGHDDAVLADYVLLNDPTADSDGAVNCTMAVTDFARYFTGRAIALRPKPRDTEANRPRRVSCDFVYSAEDDCWYLAQKGQRQLLPAEFSGWAACSPHDGVAHATTAHRTFRRMERTRTGGFRFPPEQTAAGGRCSVYIVDHTGTMQFAEVRLPAPPPPALPLLEANQSAAPSVS